MGTEARPALGLQGQGCAGDQLGTAVRSCEQAAHSWGRQRIVRIPEGMSQLSLDAQCQLKTHGYMLKKKVRSACASRVSAFPSCRDNPARTHRIGCDRWCCHFHLPIDNVNEQNNLTACYSSPR